MEKNKCDLNHEVLRTAAEKRGLSYYTCSQCSEILIAPTLPLPRDFDRRKPYPRDGMSSDDLHRASIACEYSALVGGRQTKEELTEIARKLIEEARRRAEEGL